MKRKSVEVSSQRKEKRKIKGKSNIFTVVVVWPTDLQYQLVLGMH